MEPNRAYGEVFFRMPKKLEAGKAFLSYSRERIPGLMLNQFFRMECCEGGPQKAYDRIDWSFLRQVLLSVGFSNHLAGLIMDCTISTSLWNGEKLESFQPSRGIRQGDPLSPYLFVLCMEVFGQRITQEVEGGKHSKLQEAAPRFHIYSLRMTFGEATEKQASLMADVLANFCQQSGQRVNKAKSKLFDVFLDTKSLARSIVRDF